MRAIPRIYIFLWVLFLAVSGFARATERITEPVIYPGLKADPSPCPDLYYSAPESLTTCSLGKVSSNPGEKKIRDSRVRRKFIERPPFISAEAFSLVFQTSSPAYSLFSKGITLPERYAGYPIRGPPARN